MTIKFSDKIFSFFSFSSACWIKSDFFGGIFEIGKIVTYVLDFPKVFAFERIIALFSGNFLVIFRPTVQSAHFWSCLADGSKPQNYFFSKLSDTLGVRGLWAKNNSWEEVKSVLWFVERILLAWLILHPRWLCANERSFKNQNIITHNLLDIRISSFYITFLYIYNNSTSNVLACAFHHTRVKTSCSRVKTLSRTEIISIIFSANGHSSQMFLIPNGFWAKSIQDKYS